MNKVLVPVLVASVAFASPLAARAVKAVTPLPADVVGHGQVTQYDVTISESARKTFDALEAKAARKEEAAGPAPTDPAEIQAAAYARLPFAKMFPLVARDELNTWGLNSGRALKVSLQVDTLKTADAGMALLMGSTDELAGIVSIADAATGERLGEYYVDVLNMRSGWIGLAMRGSGVREKLSAEFAKHLGEILSGRKSRSSKS